jgi:hypothetical protein
MRRPPRRVRHQSEPLRERRDVPEKSLTVDLPALHLGDAHTPPTSTRLSPAEHFSVGSAGGPEFVPPERNSRNTTFPLGDHPLHRRAVFW